MSAVQDEDKNEQLSSKKDDASSSQPAQPVNQAQTADSDLTRPSQSQPGPQPANPPEPVVDWSAEDDLLFPSEDGQSSTIPPAQVNSYLPDLNYPTPPNAGRGQDPLVPPSTRGNGRYSFAQARG